MDHNQPHVQSYADHEDGQAEQEQEVHTPPTRKKQNAS